MHPYLQDHAFVVFVVPFHQLLVLLGRAMIGHGKVDLFHDLQKFGVFEGLLESIPELVHHGLRNPFRGGQTKPVNDVEIVSQYAIDKETSGGGSGVSLEESMGWVGLRAGASPSEVSPHYDFF